MGKLISWLALALFLVVAPLVSWLYLKKGLDYRRLSLSELVPKDSIDLKSDTAHLLNGKTSLFVYQMDEKHQQIISNIQEQYKNSEGFQVLVRDSLTTYLKWPEHLAPDFLARQNKYKFLLIDTKLKLRNGYNDDEKSIKKMIEHIAIVLPRLKESDIKMKQ